TPVLSYQIRLAGPPLLCGGRTTKGAPQRHGDTEKDARRTGRKMGEGRSAGRRESMVEVGGGNGTSRRRQTMPELAEGRFFDSYGASMDAALESKVRDIEPWLVPGLVVDRGCGTGAFM